MALMKYLILACAFSLAACGFHPRGVMIDSDASHFAVLVGTK